MAATNDCNCSCTCGGSSCTTDNNTSTTSNTSSCTSSCTTDNCTTSTPTKDSGYCCNVTPETIVRAPEPKVGISSSSCCNTCSGPTRDSGFCRPTRSRAVRRRRRR